MEIGYVGILDWTGLPCGAVVSVPVVPPEDVPVHSSNSFGWMPDLRPKRRKKRHYVGDVVVSVPGPAIHAIGSVQERYTGTVTVSVAGPVIHAVGAVHVPVSGTVQMSGLASRVQAIGRVEVFVDPEDEIALVEFMRGW